MDERAQEQRELVEGQREAGSESTDSAREAPRSDRGEAPAAETDDADVSASPDEQSGSARLAANAEAPSQVAGPPQSTRSSLPGESRAGPAAGSASFAQSVQAATNPEPVAPAIVRAFEQPQAQSRSVSNRALAAGAASQARVSYETRGAAGAQPTSAHELANILALADEGSPIDVRALGSGAEGALDLESQLLDGSPAAAKTANAQQAPAGTAQAAGAAVAATSTNGGVTTASAMPELAQPNTAALDRAAAVLEQVRVHLRPGVREATLQLEPESLGRVRIDVRVHDGQMSAELRVERPEALAALEKHMPELRATLAESGFEGGSVDIGLGLERDTDAQRDASDRTRGHGAAGTTTTHRRRTPCVHYASAWPNALPNAASIRTPETTGASDGNPRHSKQRPDLRQ